MSRGLAPAWLSLPVLAAGLIVSFLGGCGAVPALPVTADLLGQRIKTTVDSEIARYYLAHYLPGERMNTTFDAILDRHSPRGGGALPTREELKHLADETSVGYAALYFAQQVLAQPDNRAVQSRYEAALARAKAGDLIAPTARPSSASYLILFVPGWVYKSNPDSGADLAEPQRVVARMGIPSVLVPIPEAGTIEEDAAVVAEEIRTQSRRGQPIILVSASSGGPAVAQALGALLGRDETRAVKAWLNIGGLLQGSALADDALRWPKRWLVRPFLWFHGWDVASVESMTVRASRARMNRLTLPPHVRVINYIGIPLSGQVSRRAQDGYRVLRRDGPSDGLTLLPDAIAPNSVTVADLGRDHFFQGPELDTKIQALAETILASIEGT